MIKCNNNFCKNFLDGKCKLKKATINLEAKCENYEKGFMYYFYYFLTMKSNFITTFDLNQDMKYSIYYLMKVLPISFSYDEIRGFIVLRNINTGDILDKDDICDMIASNNLNEEELKKCIIDFEENGLPKTSNNKEEYEEKEFGWLSPTGEYYESEWGTHEEKAQEICKQKGIKRDIKKYNCCRDLLSDLGWVLIHNPMMNGSYIVSNIKPLTKKQKDFLYNFFIDMGMKFTAEKYIMEE